MAWKEDFFLLFVLEFFIRHFQCLLKVLLAGEEDGFTTCMLCMEGHLARTTLENENEFS